MPSFFGSIHALACTPWLLVHFTASLLLCLLPRTRPAKEWSLNQAVRMRLVRLVLKYWSMLRLGNRLHHRPGSEGNRLDVITLAHPRLYKGPATDTAILPAPLAVTWTPARPPPPALVRDDLTVVLHFHGGAFVIGDGRDTDTGYLADTLRKHMGSTHVCTPQYRLSSSAGGRFPAQLQDAVTAYSYLLNQKGIPASQIILSGDSAGANIALGLLRYIYEYERDVKLPPPAAVTLWSPWVDVGAALEADMTRSPNYKTDYLNKDFGRWGASTISLSAAALSGNPYLSPLRHPFKVDGRIPVFIHAGHREVLHDDIVEYARKCAEAGWQTRLHVSAGCPHDILLLGPRIGFDDAAEAAAREAGLFLSEKSDLRLRVAKQILR